MMFLSRTTSCIRPYSLTSTFPIARPTLSGSLSRTAGADQRDVVLTLGAEDLAYLGQKRVDVVADAALAELAEGRQVAPNLRRVDVRVVGDLLRGDALLPHLPRLREHLQVPRKPGGDPDCQPFVGARLRWSL
jgi:hypothetical protein